LSTFSGTKIFSFIKKKAIINFRFLAILPTFWCVSKRRPKKPIQGSTLAGKFARPPDSLRELHAALKDKISSLWAEKAAARIQIFSQPRRRCVKYMRHAPLFNYKQSVCFLGARRIRERCARGSIYLLFNAAEHKSAS